MAYPLNRIAAVLKVHPRTIVRAITNDVNFYWTPDYNPFIEVEDICLTFSMEEAMLRRAIRGKDELLTAKEAAKELGIALPTFRIRDYPECARKGQGVVRYSCKALWTHHARKYVKS